MTTEEKNALAKEYANHNAAPFNYKLYTENFDTPEMLETAFEAGLSSRDKEVSDLVEALRKLRSALYWSEYGAFKMERRYSKGECRDRALSDENVKLADSLLSKYPVNNLPNG